MGETKEEIIPDYTTTRKRPTYRLITPTIIFTVIVKLIFSRGTAGRKQLQIISSRSHEHIWNLLM